MQGQNILFSACQNMLARGVHVTKDRRARSRMGIERSLWQFCPGPCEGSMSLARSIVSSTEAP